ncbi:MAG: biotin--[acetyl-CoA-carboxylase] ligase [Pseudomonadota bacterium]
MSAAPIHWLDSIDSTNAEALRRARAVPDGPECWIAARRQTAGRGRRGRAWRARTDDLAATLLLWPERLRPGARPSEVATLSLAAGLAAADALVAAGAPEPAVRLKWPNDVLLDGGKVAGVLLEAEGPALAIGIGVNLASAPDAAELEPEAWPPAALAARVDPPPSAEAMLERVAAALTARLAMWGRRGFAGLRADWLARAAGLGRRAEVRIGEGPGAETLIGRVRDLDADGALVLETGDGASGAPALRRIVAADRFRPDLGPAPTADQDHAT